MTENHEFSQFDSRSFHSESTEKRFSQLEKLQRDRVVAREFIELLGAIYESFSPGRQCDASEGEPKPPGLSAESKRRMQDSILKASM